MLAFLLFAAAFDAFFDGTKPTARDAHVVRQLASRRAAVERPRRRVLRVEEPLGTARSSASPRVRRVAWQVRAVRRERILRKFGQRARYDRTGRPLATRAYTALAQ